VNVWPPTETVTLVAPTLVHCRQTMLGWPGQVLPKLGCAAAEVKVACGVPEIEPEFDIDVDTEIEVDQLDVIEVVHDTDEDTVPVTDTVPEFETASMFARHDSKTAIKTKAFRDILLVPD
jgi:hypothetical protein